MNSFEDRWPDHANALKRRFAEPHRHYHDLSHVRDLLAEFDAVATNLHDPAAVELAIWYHDAVYDPHAGDNERRSADLLDADLGTSESRETLDAARSMILATIRHAVPDADDVSDAQRADCAAFLDMDLAILGAGEDAFGRYNDGIRREYDFVPDELYRPARRMVLEGFLARPALYFTPQARIRLESQARTNLARAIGDLAG